MRDTTQIALAGENEQVFTRDSLHVYGNAQPAKSVLFELKEYSQLAAESLTVSQVDTYTVQLKGLRTGEVITETYSPDNRTHDFSSSVAAHAPHRFYINAQSCPDEPLPLSWYNAFLRGNLKAGGSQDLLSDPESSGKP